MIQRATRGIRAAWLPLALAAASPAGAQDQITVTVTKSDCARLVKHVPGPDVAYRPGVDARGRPVAPADHDGEVELELPEVIELDIEVELQERFGIPANADLFEADAQVGQVIVGPDGRAYYNGQPLQDEEQFELTQRCQEIFYGRR